MTTFTEAVEQQTRLMLKIAQRLDEKGYAVVVNRLNDDTCHGEWMFTYISGGLTSFLREWGRAHGRKAVIVRVTPQAHLEKARTERIFDHPFRFSCRVSNRVPYRPINASLGLLSRKYEGRRGIVRGSGPLLQQKTSDAYCYSGETKEGVGVLLRILDMPQHRAILTTNQKG